MTRVHLVRHAAHDAVDRVLVGRMPGVHLSPDGRRQSRWLAERFSRTMPTAVFASPRERARDTAEPIARLAGLELETSADLDEIDFGSWTGATFDALSSDPDWITWNSRRDIARPPNGESMEDACMRVLRFLRPVAARPGTCVVAVSHRDVIRSALVRISGMPFSHYDAFDIPPATIATIDVDGPAVRIVAIEEPAEVGPVEIDA